MADLEGTVNFSDGELVGELGASVIGGGSGEDYFIIPIETTQTSPTEIAYSTTVTFKEIDEAYLAGKPFKIQKDGVARNVVSIAPTDMVGYIDPETDEFKVQATKYGAIVDFTPGFLDNTDTAVLHSTQYFFAAVQSSGESVPPIVTKSSYSFAGEESSIAPAAKFASYVGMIIHSTTLDTKAKVIEMYGGTDWQKIEGRFLLGASSTHAAGSTGGSEDATLPAHTHEVTNNDISTSFHVDGPDVDYSFSSDTINYSSGSESKNVLTGVNVQMTNYGQGHSHTVPGTGTAGMVVDWEDPTFVNIGETGSSPVGANMPPYKTVYIWERTA